YYGVDIHGILDEYNNQKSSQKATVTPVETSVDTGVKCKPQLLWTEKYRAKKFTDLIGDERTHRDVLRWMKRWDRIVFPAQHRAAQKRKAGPVEEEPEHRKILLLHGPPGLGKTTLAHVAARQAGYEPLEINASDDRSGGVVKGKIKDMLTIEGVKSCGLISGKKKLANAGKPVCLVIDEIDGVTGGGGGSGESGGGARGSEAGFIKALIDLIMEDRKTNENGSNLGTNKRRSKKESFKLRRPIIAVCNDLYAPALKPLRQFAEIVQMRVPPVNLIVERLECIFQKEGYATENGAVRKLVELSSMAGSTRKGDMRGALVNGEWIAAKMKLDPTMSTKNPQGRKILTRKAVEDELVGNRIGDSDGKGSNGGRMIMRDALESVFHIKRDPPGRGAAAKIQKKSPVTNLQELVEGLGEFSKLTMDCFATYPTKNFNDDSILTKPNTAYEWLFFSDIMSPRVHNEAAASSYLTYPILAFHHLFASGAGPSSANNLRDKEDDKEQLPFSGAGADWEAYEAQKEHTSTLNTIHSSLATPQLSQTFKNPASIAMELAPFVNRMLSPQINPVLVSGSGYAVASVRRDSEKKLVARAVNAMEAVVLVGSGWAYRMDPPLDAMGIFPTFNEKGEAVRYAVRQVLDQEWRKLKLSKQKAAREARMGTLPSKIEPSSIAEEDTKDPDVRPTKKVKRDFFGRIVVQNDGVPGKKGKVDGKHEGVSKAVKKGLTLEELIAGMT
ncbi:P-loop containing nucleoside triphosphate hydrolase protein, partial [Trichophaea hybrida]